MTKFSDVMMDHFQHPRNAGALADADGVGQSGTHGQGPVMSIWVKLDGQTIEKATFKAYGCGPAIATCSLLTEMVTGRLLEDALGVSADELLEQIGGLPLGKRHCPPMAIEALQRAIHAAKK